jgi:hypothetical protein
MKIFFQCFLFFALCLASLESIAQDGLKFSKTFIIEVPKDGHAFTVPEGKIWRIEVAGGTGFSTLWIENKLEEKMFVISLHYGATGGSFQSHFNLNSNFSGKFSMTGTAKDAKGFVSITEYTITP